MEGEGCVDQVRVYDEPRASLAVECYLGTPGMDTYDGRSPGWRCYGGMVNGNPDEDILA